MATIVLLYSGVSIINYIFYLVPVWERQGFPEFQPSTGLVPLFFSILCCTVFAISYPKTIHRYSQFVVWFLFFFVFCPSVVIVAMQGFPEDHGIVLISCLSISMFLIGYIPEFFQLNNTQSTLFNFSRESSQSGEHKPVIKSDFETVLIFIFLFLLIPLVFFYRNVIAFVDITDVYTQREMIEDMSPNRSLEAYALSWLLRVIAPLLIAIGIMAKRNLLHVLGLFGMAIGFFISGSKFIVFSVPLMYALNGGVLNKKLITAINVGKSFLAIFSITLIFTIVYDRDDVKSFVGVLLSQILKRAFSINGMTIGNYYDFFINSNNEVTFYSHLGPISKIIDYPYGEFGIGQVVGFNQVGVYTYDMSAGFWSTDGIAAAGLLGIIIIGFILGVILLVFDALSKRIDLRLLCLASIGNIWMLADTSVFRVLLSGGWPLHFVLIAMYLKSIRDNSLGKIDNLAAK